MFQKANSFLAGVRQNLYLRCKWPMREAVREQCLCNDVNIQSRGVAQGGYKVKQHSIIIDALGGWSQ